MENINWTSFQKRILIERPVERVYSAWAVRANLEHWFLEKASYTDKNGKLRRNDDPVKKDDHFIWKWNNWDYEEEGDVLLANEKDLISFSFGIGGVVHLRFKDIKGTTEVTLTQEQIPEDDRSKQLIFTGCACGWTFWLTNLKAWLEHGITLHAKGFHQDQIVNMVNC